MTDAERKAMQTFRFYGVSPYTQGSVRWTPIIGRRLRLFKV